MKLTDSKKCYHAGHLSEKPPPPHLRTILDSFLKSANEIKDLELHFTMGEATVHAAMGPRAPAARDEAIR